MTKILVIGEAMVDLHVTPQVPFAFGSDTPSLINLEPGGSGTNVAAWLDQLGLDVWLIAAIGDDPLGVFLQDQCRKTSIHTGFITHPTMATGTCVVLLDMDGERSMFPDSGSNMAINVDNLEDLDAVQHVHVSGYSLVHPSGKAICDLMSEFPGTCSLDLASTAIMNESDTIQRAAELADVVFGTDQEFECLSEVSPYAISVIKHGGQGVRAVGPGADEYYVPAPAANVKSTTGAGDAFAAGFLMAWLLNPQDIPGALDLGSKCAHATLERVAAWPQAHVAEG